MKTFSIAAAILFLAIGVYLFCACNDGLFGGLTDRLLYSCLPFGISAILLLIGAKSDKKTAEQNSYDAETSLNALRDKGLLSELEYQQKLKMSGFDIQKSMDDLKSLKEIGIITEEEYQQKVNQLLNN